MTEDAARRNTRARFEQWAANPACAANTFSAVHNVKMADVTASEGFASSSGQSPFALARGETFERSLFDLEAQRLIEALVAKEVLPADANGFEDHRIGMNGGPLASLDDAIEATRALLVRAANATTVESVSGLPAVVAAATVRIPRGVMLPEAILIIDALAVIPREDEPHLLMVGEVKTYPDRGGYTDRKSLAVARAQAGIYVHALDVVVEDLGISDQVEVARRGFLVLTRPGSNFPSVRPFEDLRYQAERARRGFELLEAAALQLPPYDGGGDDPCESIRTMDTAYSEACLMFCERAERCHQEAVAHHDPAILGDDARRFFGDVPLDRALLLLEGRTPATPIEEDLMRRIAELDFISGRG